MQLGCHEVRLYATRTGQYFLPDAPTDVVAKAIRQGRTFDSHVVKAASRHIRKGSTVLDVGACYGQMSILFSRMVGPSGTVIAIEASPFQAELTRRNLLINGVTNITLIDRPVWHTPGVLVRYPKPDFTIFGSYGSFGIDPIAQASDCAWDLTTTTIDSITIPSPLSLMKVDIQGSDLNALLGARETIAAHRPTIVFEYEALCTERFGQSLDDYWRFVDAIGYKLVRTVGPSDYLITARERVARHRWWWLPGRS